MSDESRATYTLRASRELLDRLKKAADDRSHSMNAEIVQRLEASFPFWENDEGQFLQGVDLGKLTAEENLIVGILRQAPPEARKSVLNLLRALVLKST